MTHQPFRRHGRHLEFRAGDACAGERVIHAPAVKADRSRPRRNAFWTRCEGPDLDDEELADLLAALSDDDGGPADRRRSGRNRRRPTGADRAASKASPEAGRAAAKSDAAVEDRAWLEQTPQMLPVITEGLIGRRRDRRSRDDKLVAGCINMLTLQLEFVRYRQDRGWDWAERMLNDFQQRLIELGEAGRSPQQDWFDDGLRPDRSTGAGVGRGADGAGRRPASTLAGTGAAGGHAGHAASASLDELAHMVTSPFEVIEALQQRQRGDAGDAAQLHGNGTGAVVARRAARGVPLMLLDDDSPVRRACGPGDGADRRTRNAVARRAAPGHHAIRNWIPAADRPAVDSAIRKARLAGRGDRHLAGGPRARSRVCIASMIDGSGAQSILAVSRSARRGCSAACCCAMAPAWWTPGSMSTLSRGKINRLLQEAQMGASFARVDKALCRCGRCSMPSPPGSAQGTCRPKPLLQIAEVAGGSEWKESPPESPKAEADRLFRAEAG